MLCPSHSIDNSTRIAPESIVGKVTPKASNAGVTQAPHDAMPLHLADEHCLRPRLLGAAAGTPCRVVGLLRRTGESGPPRLVDAVEFDGERCRYRTLGDGIDADRWLDERADDDYRPCARAVVDRMILLARSGAAGHATHVTDAVMDADGRITLTLLEQTWRSGRRVEA